MCVSRVEIHRGRWKVKFEMSQITRVLKGASDLAVLKTLPQNPSAVSDPQTTLLIYDRRLFSASKEFKVWAKSFPHQRGFVGGEKLKALSAFPQNAEKLAHLVRHIAPHELTVLAVGGGSIGDFAGFFASVFKRGVRLVHMPTTWLAALDSSHGGKTALNASGAKNQFGTFYPAESVVLVGSLLNTQPRARVLDAMGELGKIALLDRSLFRILAKSRLHEAELLWSCLPLAILAKQKIVAKDPHERMGHRQILNLGHTVGHVFETTFGWSHGFSVAQGLFFALDFARQLEILSPKDFAKASEFLVLRLGLSDITEKRPFLSKVAFEKLLGADKKRMTEHKVVFVFLTGIGKPLRRAILFSEIVREAQRQGWVK